MTRASDRAPALDVVGLFAGIGGIEVGLHESGHRTALLCEIDTLARRVLEARLPGCEVVSDVRELRTLPRCDLVAAGFPCQDLSQAGRTRGIRGQRSGLVGEVFRLLERADPTWLLLENVPFMLSLERGNAMSFLTQTLHQLGFRWAYRVVDTRAFGIPQRRQRVLLLASRRRDPREILLVDEAGAPETDVASPSAFGFYWTEGIKGLGWAVDSVPTLKGGSTVGIPSPPAIWIPSSGEFATPDLRDAERLQGFPAEWTAPADADPTRRNTMRWKLVGNAVSVPVAAWIGRCLRAPRAYDAARDGEMRSGESWPGAAWNDGDRTFRAAVSQWPDQQRALPLMSFLSYPTRPLSARAAAGFASRMKRGHLRFDPSFRRDMEAYVKRNAVRA